MLRFIHTSDWHLGHSLHDLDRRHEHAAFLDWLLNQLQEHASDALLIAGDIFDTANPPASAQRAWYGFLADARQRCPKLDIVVIGGNHDSAGRLDAPREVLDGFGIRVVGGLPLDANREPDFDRLIAPLHDATGAVAAHVVALPYLRAADLPSPAELGLAENEDPLIEGVRARYRDAVAAAQERAQPHQALIAMGHLYMSRGTLSETSERKILGGNLHALPNDIFEGACAYVALGHLHLAQAVGAKHIRYSGSPIPLSLSEARYKHQILSGVLDGPQLHSLASIHVPRTVDMIRVPTGTGALRQDEALAALAKLPAQDGPAHTRAFLEVHIQVDAPEPGLRHQVQEAIKDRNVRLARLAVHRTGSGAALADQADTTPLKERLPQDVFRRRWARDHAGEPSERLMGAFLELLEQVQLAEREKKS